MTRVFGFALPGLLATGLLAAGCNDAVIGTEPCIGTAALCKQTDAMPVTFLDVDFVPVETSQAADLPVLGREPSPCDLPCEEPIKLLSAGAGAWTIPRAGQRPGLKLLPASGAGADVRMPSPTPGSRLAGYHVSSDQSGSALAHMQWTLPDGAPFEEMALFSPWGTMERFPLITRTRAPLGAVQARNGFFLFQGTQEGSFVRLVGLDGASMWQQAFFPPYASQLGDTAVSTPYGFELPASDGIGRISTFGLLSLDAMGKTVRYARVIDSTWRSAQLLSLGQNEYALAAESELQGVLETINNGNIDVVIARDEGGGRGNDKLRGFRLERFCFHPLLLNGFAADPERNLYVSTLTGDVNEPRGLLCELPTEGEPRCFRGLPNQLFGSVAALGNGALFVASGDEILRVQLPQL